jgi:hypothetical protein
MVLLGSAASSIKHVSSEPCVTLHTVCACWQTHTLNLCHSQEAQGHKQRVSPNPQAAAALGDKPATAAGTYVQQQSIHIRPVMVTGGRVLSSATAKGQALRQPAIVQRQVLHAQYSAGTVQRKVW